MDTQVDTGRDVDRLLEITRGLVALALRSVEAAAPTVTLPQYRALLVLDRVGPCNGSGLAEQLGTHGSTVTRICDRLEALGYVTRALKAGNRREVEIVLAGPGRRVVDAVERYRGEAISALLAAMDGGDRDHLARALPGLQAAASQLPSGWAH